jgi:2-(1,2-epoxy-1,2-dihydrophenyl)acetyl-CoA isomerase
MNTTGQECIELALEQGLLTVTLNRPAVMNAVSTRMAAELRTAFEEAAADDGVRCVLVRGAGKAFCAGRDLSEAKPNEDAYAIITEVLSPMLKAVYDMPKPTIAAVNGVAMGVGLGIALACDIVYAADNARFSSPFANLGVALDSGGHYFLPRLLSVNRTLEMIYTADVIRGRQAEAWGLVNRSVPGSKLAEWTHQLGCKLAAGPTNAFVGQKRLVRQSESLSYAEVLDAEARLQADLVRRPEYAEGLAAFKQKRKPDFRNASRKQGA